MDPASGNVQPAVSIAGYTATERGESQLLLVHELRSGEHRTVISAADHSLVGIQSSKAGTFFQTKAMGFFGVSVQRV